MCDPILFGTAATAATSTTAATAATAGLFGMGGQFALGTTLSTLGSAMGVMNAFNQSNQYDEMANIQRDIARQKADDAKARGIVEENKQRRVTNALKGKQAATLGSQLVEMDSGSASDLMADTAMMGELDALTIRNNAQREAYGHQTEGMANAAMYEAKADKAKMDGFGSMLSMAAPVADNWYDSQSALVTSSPKLAWNGKASFDSAGYV